MQRLTILALLAPCVLLSAPAFAEPAQPSGSNPTVWPADAPPAPEPPAAPTVPPGWGQPSTAPGTATAPPTLPPPAAATPIALFATRPPVASALYLQGFDVSWETRPHRLRSLVIVADAGAPSGATPPTGALLARVQGGSWADGEVANDVAMVNLAYGGITSPSAPIYRGAVRAALRGEASPARAPVPAIVTIPVEVPLAGAPTVASSEPATPYDSGAVFLQGLAIETDGAHPDGFTPHVLSVQLGPVTVANGVARFDLTLEVQAAAVPDRDQHLVSYGAEVEVGWVLVPATAARVHRVQASGGAAHGIEIDAMQSQAEPVPLPVGTDLRPGTRDVAVGLSGFRVAIDQTGVLAGRYLRSFGVTLADTGVDPWRGRWDGIVEARFSNAGEVTRAESVALQADVTVLELAEGERSWSGRWTTPVTGDAQRIPYPGPIQRGTR